MTGHKWPHSSIPLNMFLFYFTVLFSTFLYCANAVVNNHAALKKYTDYYLQVKFLAILSYNGNSVLKCVIVISKYAAQCTRVT